MGWFRKLFFDEDKDKVEKIAEKIANNIVESDEDILESNKKALKTIENGKATGKIFECEYGCGIPIEEGIHKFRTFGGKKYHNQCFKELKKMANKELFG